MIIDSTFTLKHDGKVKARYLFLTTPLKVEEVLTVAKSVDPYLANVMKVEWNEVTNTTTIRASVYKAQRVPKFARFVYEILDKE